MQVTWSLRPVPGVTTVSALILGREGMNADNAKSFLSSVMGRTDQYLSLLHNDALGSLSRFLPQPPTFTAPQVRWQETLTLNLVRHTPFPAAQAQKVPRPDYPVSYPADPAAHPV